MTVKELASRIGQNGLLEVDGFRIKVKVNNARQIFGRVDFLVEPIDGEGEHWVSDSRLVFLE